VLERPRHDELGRFLRACRRRTTPASVGLRATGRRRSHGLRREEVAVLANVSPTWYAYLEQGRQIRPSVAVLDSIADAMRLTVTERRYLHALGAGPADSVLPATAPTETDLALVRSLVTVSADIAYPVYAAGAAGDLIAWNAATEDWYTPFSALPREDRNVVVWLFGSPAARDRIANWHHDARGVAARVRFFVGTNRPDPTVAATVRRVHAACAEFVGWWDEYIVSEQDATHRTFRRGDGAERTLQMFVVRPTVCPAVSVVFHLPVPPS
jgi:transcriptional regulator with XRE-family HTH domain